MFCTRARCSQRGDEGPEHAQGLDGKVTFMTKEEVILDSPGQARARMGRCAKYVGRQEAGSGGGEKLTKKML